MANPVIITIPSQEPYPRVIISNEGGYLSLNLRLDNLQSQVDGLVVSAGVTGISATGGQGLFGLVNFTAIGGGQVIQSGNNIIISGGAGSSSDTGALTGSFYPLYSNPSGYVTFLTLSGVSGVLSSRLDATGSSLLGLIQAASAGVSAINGRSGILTFTGAGNTTISMAGQAFTVSGNTGEYANFYSISNPSGYIPSSQTGQFASANNLNSTGFNLQGQIDTITTWTGFSTGLYYPRSTNPSGYVTGSVVRPSETGNFITAGQTGAFYAATNPNNYITYAQVGGVQTINVSGLPVSGALTYTGAGNVTITRSGQTIIWSGDTGSLASSINLGLTGSNLQGQINTITTWTGFSTGLYYPYSSNPAGYVTGLVVRPSETGSFITTSQTGAFYAASNPNNYIAYAQVGGVQTVNVTGLLVSGALNFTGAGNVTVSKSGQTIIWSGDTGSLASASSLASTGASLQSQINTLTSWTGLTTGLYYPYTTNPSGYATYSQLTGASGNLSDRLNTTGSTLLSLIQAASAGVSSINGRSGILTLNGAGNNTVLTAGQTITVSGNTGEYANFYSISNPSGYISNSGFITGGYNVGGGSGIFSGASGSQFVFKTLIGGSGILISGNSGNSTLTFIVTGLGGGAGGGEANTASNIGGGSGIAFQKVGVDLQFKSLKAGSDLSITGGTGELSINLTGSFARTSDTGNFITAGQTGQFYAATNPNNYITYAQVGGVQTLNVSGLQVSGNVVLTGAGNVTVTKSGQTIIWSGDTGSLATAINLASTGSNLQSQINTLTSWTGITTGLYYPLMANPSGYVTGAVVRPNDTGNFITAGQTGQFYAATNPNNYITYAQVGGVQTINISGLQVSGALVFTGAGNVVITKSGQTITWSGDTGSLASAGSLTATGSNLQGQINTITNWTGVTTGLYYPLRTNPSGYVTGSVVRPTETGNFITAGQTGQFYAATNPNNYITYAQVGGVQTVNISGLQVSGNLVFTGAGNVSITLSGQTVMWSGSTGSLASAINLAATGSNLQGQINTITSWTGTTTGLYYPYSSNPAGYLTAAGGVDGVTGISVTGGIPISGLATFTGIGGFQVIQEGNTIKFSGGAGTQNITNNTYVNSGSGMFAFQTVIVSGTSQQFINFPTTLDSNPTIVASVRNDVSSNMLPVQISGATNTGYWAIFGETVDSTGYRLNTFATNSTGTGLATLVITNPPLGVYRNFWVDAGAMLPTVSSGATAGTVNYNGTDLLAADAFLFDDTTPEYINFKLMMPDEWDKNSIKVKLGWSPSSGNGNVVWEIAGASVGDLQNIGSGLLGTPVTVIDSGVNTGQFHLTTGSPALTVGNTPNTGMMTYFRVGRLPGNSSDTVSGDAKLLGIGIQYLESTTLPTIW